MKNPNVAEIMLLRYNKIRVNALLLIWKGIAYVNFINTC